jgi:histidinol-phosphate/aromatic aminotransferase/cobyric acid decarboxylase-like protein
LPKNHKNLPKMEKKKKKKPLKQRDFKTHAGFHGNHFRLSVGTTTEIAKTSQKLKPFMCQPTSWPVCTFPH